MPPCSNCAALSLQTLIQQPLYFLQTKEQSKNKPSKVKGVVFLQSAQDLHQSAQSCPTCFLFQKGLQDELEASQPGILLGLSTEPLLLRAMFDPLGQGFLTPPSDGHYMTSIQVIARQQESGQIVKGRVRIHVDQSEGALTRPCDIVGRPRLSGTACPDTVALLLEWVNACQERHPQCKETLSGSLIDDASHPVLPTRILEVHQASVRLVEPKGLRGRYLTLSYCWGPPDKAPLVTTMDNVSSRLENIDVTSLPKTYQDAITISRQMDIRYLWIDSLCIVQDDHDDWLRESKKMGSIYEHADLTIAASHAPDAWSGFLHPRKERTPPIELQNFLQPEDGLGVKVFATIREDDACDVFPEAGALNYRAWATQEWLLSRRVVFFAPANLMWSCKHITQRETGERCFTISRNTHWKSVVEGFSSRSLTYPMDKLVALEGLRTEWGKKTGYTYISGVWRESLPDQLIWHIGQQLRENAPDPLELPTWSWMHVPSSIRFLPINGAKSICKSIEVSENGRRLSVSCRFKLIFTVPGIFDNQTNGQDLSALVKDVDGLHGFNPGQARDMVSSIVENGHITGWVIYDREELARDNTKHFAMAVMSTARLKDDKREQLTGQPADKKLRETWIIVVRQSSKGIYERIGAGKIYGRGPWNRIMIDEIELC